MDGSSHVDVPLVLRQAQSIAAETFSKGVSEPQLPEGMPPLPTAPPDAKQYYPPGSEHRADNFKLWKYGSIVVRDKWVNEHERIDAQLPEHVKVIQLRSQVFDDGGETRAFFCYDPDIADVVTANISGDEGKKRMEELTEEGYRIDGELHDYPQGEAQFVFVKTKPKGVPEIQGETPAIVQSEAPAVETTPGARNESDPQAQADVAKKDEDTLSEREVFGDSGVSDVRAQSEEGQPSSVADASLPEYADTASKEQMQTEDAEAFQKEVDAMVDDKGEPLERHRSSITIDGRTLDYFSVGGRLYECDSEGKPIRFIGFAPQRRRRGFVF